MKTIAFVGMGRHGKDECCRLWAEITGGTNAGTLSKYLCNTALAFVNSGECTVPFQPQDLLYENRHNNRELWMQAGHWYCKDDPSRLLKDALFVGNITGGIRRLREVQAAKSLLDLIVWVERPGWPKDPTVEFTSSDADCIILNDGTLEQLHQRLVRLHGGLT